MIQLDFMKKSFMEREKIVRNFYNDIAIKSNRIEDINNWCNNNLDIEGLFDSSYYNKKSSFEKIVTADFNTLVKIKNYIDRDKNISMDNKLKKYMINTMYKKNLNRLALVNALDVSVCPYCNRNYINSYYKNTNYQFDHFFSKDKYPIFAVSFYNLIPVCPSCNHKKTNVDFSYSPYDDSITTDEMLTFSYLPKGINYLNDNSELEIVLNLDENKILEKNIEKLGLKELYNIHADIVQELIIKKLIYADEYIEQIYNNFHHIFNSLEEIENLLTGGYTTPDKYGKRPLSKLVSDISKEIDLIGRI